MHILGRRKEPYGRLEMNQCEAYSLLIVIANIIILTFLQHKHL
jgi:hypothetical protein